MIDLCPVRTQPAHHSLSTVRYAGINREVSTASPHKTLLQLSLENKIPHLHECGGQGKCTTCRVRVSQGAQNLSPRSALERELSEKRHWDPRTRLACQARVHGDVEVERLIWTSAEVQQIQKEEFPEDAAIERPIAILFCDLRDFTKMASKELPFDMAYMLNRFYTTMGEPILMNNGIIYQYVGDEIVGIFGTTGADKQRACTDAVRAAFGMSIAMDQLNHHELAGTGLKLSMGIGIHFGKSFIGHLGHPQFRQFSVIGDPVNTASRIQAFTRDSNTNMLISETVAEALPDHLMTYGNTFQPHLKGLGNGLKLIELIRFSEMDVQLELQTTLHLLLEKQDTFAARFYDNLFTRDPALLRLFKGDMATQGRMLMHMLMGIVYALSRPEHLSSGLAMLGRHHVSYGVKPAHYPVAHATFMQTIEEILGQECTEKRRAAWSAALTMIINGMKSGAN